MPVHVVGDGNGAADQSCRQIVRLSRRPGDFRYATRRISPTRTAMKLLSGDGSDAKGEIDDVLF